MKSEAIENYLAPYIYNGVITKEFDNITYGTWIVEIENDNKIYEIPLFIPARRNPNSNLSKFIKSTGILPDTNGDLDLSKFIGLHVIVTVADKISKKDGNTYSNISTIELDPTPAAEDDELPF